MTNKRQLLEKFNTEYHRLNAEQRKAVDTIEGPVMVIAGPGTGKTQILSARIGKILLDTDTLPGNILCLTYTDAGVVAMRRRLLQFIGPDAYKVNIYTFHAFCNDIIQENLSLFEKNSLDPISDLERIELLKQLIDNFPKNHPLKRYRGDVYYEISNLQKLFSDMKREGWSPEFINRKIDEYIASLPYRDEYIAKRAVKEFKKGDVRTDKIAEETERVGRLRAAVNEFDNYQKMMREKNRYDFDDMINWVIEAFESNKELLANYQERFLYILVDEYQDTSGTQNKLVELLINYWEQPNVFVVGDDDQSIYRFQGANVENMESFALRYENDLFKVVLVNNYRSTQPILNASKALIDWNQQRLVNKMQGLSKHLIAANNEINQFHQPPVIKEYESQQQEMAGIAMRVQQLLQEGITPGDIGIIYRENKYGEEIASYLKHLDVPVYSKRSINLFTVPLVQKILLLLRYLAAEHDTPYGGDEMLFELLHFNWFSIQPIEIAKLCIEVNSKQFTAQKTSLRRLLYEKSNQPPMDLFSQGLPDSMKKASKALEDLISDVSNVTLQNLLEEAIQKAGILQWIMQSEDKFMQLQVLTHFFNFVKEETRRNPLLKLDQLINITDMMQKEGLPLPMTEVSGSEKGVNLMTAHGSKGLEFLYVFFTGCNASTWEKKRKPNSGFSLPDTVFQSHSKQDDEEELRRLFYVAMTRAEQHLEISYSRFRNDGRELEPSMFIAEIQDKEDLQVERVLIDKEKAIQFDALQLQRLQAPEISVLEKDFIGPVLERFVMNVTALNNYLKCPLEFYFKNLVRIPSPKNEATEFGSSVHHALEQLFRKMQADTNGRFPAKEVFIKDFEWHMYRHRESFTQEQFNRRMEYGHEILSNYYDKYILIWNKIVSIERSIKNVVVNGIPLKGKLDKLEFEGKLVNVVDYKTGDPEKGLKKLNPPNEKEPLGGDYWRQAVFYKILLDNLSNSDWQAISAEFDFVEPDKKKDYVKKKLVISPADITTVKEQVRTVWEKIQQHDFYTGCGKEDCHWCNFVKTNDLAVALHDLSDEEETEA